MNVKIITLGLICVLLLMLVSCGSSKDPYEPTYSYFNKKAEKQWLIFVTEMKL